jgi:BirA family biotin operon repressor/biotin-[acetyl-CoA-carboxylase] ligase
MTAALPILPDGFRLLRYDTVGSSNDELKRLARAGAADRTVVWAGAQTAGRGRRGRHWVSPPGNLYASVLLRPDCPVAAAAQLGFVAAVAMAEALGRVAAVAVECKWPNDLLLHGRKLAGILLESETGGGERADFVVIGIGVNLASAPHGTETPAISLAETGAAVSPEVALAAFAAAFAPWIERWAKDGFAPVRAAWLGRACGLGGPVRVRLENATLFGRFADLDEAGALLLDEASGRRRVSAGEIFPALG